MKKIFISLSLIIALTLTGSRAFAQAYQPFPTDVASWEVLRCWYFYPSGWHDKYTLDMDGTESLYQGMLFKNIYITPHHLPGTELDTIYPKEFFGGLREVDKQIFIYQKWASVDTSVMLVYDFNATEPGDTIYTNVLSGNPYLFGHLVVGIDSVQVGNNFHRRLYLQDVENAYNTEYWIEGVGSSWGLPFASFWSITDNSYDLSCFYSEEQLKYVNDSPQFGYCASFPEIDCEPISAVEDPERENVLFDLYPNPTAGEVVLNLNSGASEGSILKIYNLTGALIRSEKILQNRQELNLGELGNGIYLLVVQTKHSTDVKRLVIHK